MTDTPPPGPEAAFFTSIRDWKLVRGDNGVVGGVVEGLGAAVGLAAAPARLIVVIAAIMIPGPIAMAYAAAWGLLPDSRGNIIIQNFGRGVTNVGALVGILFLTVVGLVAMDVPFPLFNVHGPFDGRFGGLAMSGIVLLIVVGALVWLVVWALMRSREQSSPDPAGPAAGTAPPAAVAAPPSYRGPYVPGPGPGGYLAALAVVIIAVAAVAWVARTEGLAVHPATAWFGALLVGLGVILVAVSAVGRKQGFLGFISVPLVLAGLAGTFYAEPIRDSMDSLSSWRGEQPEEYVDDAVDSMNPIEYFSDDYATIVVAPVCHAGELATGEPIKQMYFSSVDTDIHLDIVDPAVEISIPAGTSLVLEASGWAQSAIAWPERGLWCDFWDGGGVNLRLHNPDTPTVYLTVHDDAYVNTIFVKELP